VAELPETTLAGLGFDHRTHSPPLLERPPTSRGRETAVTVISKFQRYVVLNKSRACVWEYCTYQVVVVVVMLRRREELEGEGFVAREATEQDFVSAATIQNNVRI
jgi:hypothetical protein